jgi:Fe-S-cluster-containing dehydrogenase component
MLSHSGVTMKQISRRQFLKSGLLTAAAVTAAPIPEVVASPNRVDAQIATLIDISKCIGCEACVDACREVNQEKYPRPQKPFPRMIPSRVPVEDWSDREDVRDRLTPYNWLFIQHIEVTGKDGKPIELTIPRRCMHCVNPPCVKLCPWGAAVQEKNGISRIDSDLCLGGAKCKSVCPWKIPQRQTGAGLYLDILPSLAGNGVMNKCDRCYDRISSGKLPACVDACPEGVQTIGSRREIVQQAHDLAKAIGGYIYGETENGGTNTLYVSPVPFEELNRSIGTISRQGQSGIPHLKHVSDSMGDGNRLMAAMILAPIAGAASAVGKFIRSQRKPSSGGVP